MPATAKPRLAKRSAVETVEKRMQFMQCEYSTSGRGAAMSAGSASGAECTVAVGQPAGASANRPA